MPTVVLSNIHHYHHLARALHEGGILSKYITVMSPYADSSIPSIIPGHWRHKLDGRRLDGIPVSSVKQFWLPETLQKVLPMIHACSADRANWVNDNLLDMLATRYIEDCNVFHFVNSVGLRCARKAKGQGATVVCDVRQEHPAFQKKLLSEEALRLGLRATYRESANEFRMIEEYEIADLMLVPSQHAKRTFVSEGISEDKIRVVPYGVDLNHFRPGPNRSSLFRVLFVGQVTARKGIQYLLQAFSRLRIPNSELLLVGPIDPAFRTVLDRYAGVFRHVPPVPKVVLKEYYQSSSVFALPSLADAYPLVVLEAMACGLPVIITSNTGSAEAITDGKEGFVLPIRDSAAIAEKIQLLYENNTLRGLMSIAAEKVARKCNWEAYRTSIISLYKRLP